MMYDCTSAVDCTDYISEDIQVFSIKDSVSSPLWDFIFFVAFQGMCPVNRKFLLFALHTTPLKILPAAGVKCLDL